MLSTFWTIRAWWLKCWPSWTNKRLLLNGKIILRLKVPAWHDCILIQNNKRQYVDFRIYSGQKDINFQHYFESSRNFLHPNTNLWGTISHFFHLILVFHELCIKFTNLLFYRFPSTVHLSNRKKFNERCKGNLQSLALVCCVPWF